MAGLLYVPNYMPALDQNADPISGALLYVYQNETTTLATVYTDLLLTTPLTNPVVANASGVFPLVYADSSVAYSVSITTPGGAPLAAFDGVPIASSGPLELGQPTILIDAFGADSTGVGFSDLAWTLAVAALGPKGGCIEFGQGRYTFATPKAFNFPTTPNAALTVRGQGSDTTVVYFPTTSGFIFTQTLQNQTIHIRDLSITTGSEGVNNALTLINTVGEGNFGQNDVSGVTFRGDDGGVAAEYWGTAILVEGMSNINIVGDLFYGNAAGTGGIAVALQGRPASENPIGLIYNMSLCGFFSNGIAIEYGSQAQGLTVSQCNFTNGVTGILIPTDATDVGQLSVTGCQFDQVGNDIDFEASIEAVSLIGNLFIDPTPGTLTIFSKAGITVKGMSIIGNFFSGVGGAQVGISLSSATDAVISGNTFNLEGTAIALGAATANVNVYGNVYDATITTKVTNASANNSVGVATS